MNEEQEMNRFFDNIKQTINTIPDYLKQNYINYEVNNLLKKINTNYVHTNLNYFFEIKKICGDYGLEKVERVKYINNDCDIILIAQYYETTNEQRQKENTISLINNILNDSITKIHLLNEKEYDLSHILNRMPDKYKKKVKQHVIEKRMTFNDGMGFANTFCKNKIIIIANLDIFFTPELSICKTYDFTNLFLSLSRYELLNEFNFDGNNKLSKFVHEGTFGNPCIDSHDAWMFKAPIKMTPKSKIMLGSEGCDTIINYVYGEIMKYNVVNPINSIITIHYHRERERSEFTQNRVRSHSGLIYNSNNEFTPEDHQHKYVLQKSVCVCNKIESFCTFATKGAYKDLRLLLHSLELYHSDIPVFILCDKWVNDKIEEDNYNLEIYKKVELDQYTNMNRKMMEQANIFIEFLLNKANVMDYAMEIYENTLFIDADIILLNKFDLLIDKQYDVALSPHHIFEESEKKFGKYNAGFMFIANKNVTNTWRKFIKTRSGFDDQQALDWFSEEFKVCHFDTSYNYGWWRLFQCENPNERANLFMINDDELYYEYNTLKCIHTHLYEENDYQTIQFNTFILNIMDKIDHPMLKYINQSDADIRSKQSITPEKNINTEKSINPKIIIPKQPRVDMWKHAGDTFRELVSLWKENNYCDVIEEDTKHVWMNNIGDILLYDRPTYDWFVQDLNIKYNRILFGNPVVPENLRNCASSWIFWGRSPRKLDKFYNMSYKEYNERILESIFIGKIENNVQLKYRNEDLGKYIQLYVMHKPDEKYRYNQDEYLDLLRNSKFGLCLRGYGPKCNREIELMALGTVPIVEKNVDMDNYYDPPQENIHYLRFESANEIKVLMENCSEEKWNQMSMACREWYKKNASIEGSFNTTMEIINDTRKEYQETNKNIVKNDENNISNKMIFNFGMEAKFDRENLKSCFNIEKIYNNHKKHYNDCEWNNINTFNKVQKIGVYKFENIHINTDGIMYDDDDENIYTFNNEYYKKELIETKNLFHEFDENQHVFNCVQKNGSSYYHWICEVFSRLFYIKLYIENNRSLFENKKIVLLLYYNNSFIHECIEMLNISNIEICPYNPTIEYIAKNVYMITPCYPNNPSRESIKLIRQSLFMGNIIVPKVNVVLKRSNNKIISNFDVMMTFLRKKYSNYEWIVFDDKDPQWKNMKNTIQLFSMAKLIIGANGDGLSNMIFSSDKVKIIELYPENLGNVCYWHLSQVIGNTHYVLPVQNKNEIEFDVSVEQLDYTIDKLLNDVFCVENI